MKKALVTGATGFLGSHLVRYLNEIKIPVRIYRRQASSLKRIQDCEFEDFVGELGDEGALRRAVSGCDTFFHLAANTSFLERDHAVRWKTNVIDLEKILQIAWEVKGLRFVYCSTAGTAGYSKAPEILNENSGPFSGSIDYFITKRKAEELVLEASKNGLDAVIVNPATVIGPGMREAQRRALSGIQKGKFVFYLPGGSTFCFAKDVIRGMVSAALYGKKGERYILGGHTMTFREYFQSVAKLSDVKPPKLELPAFLLPVAGLVAEVGFGKYGKDFGVLASSFGYYSSEKAKQELKYEMTPFEEMIKVSLASLGDL